MVGGGRFLIPILLIAPFLSGVPLNTNYLLEKSLLKTKTIQYISDNTLRRASTVLLKIKTL